MMRSDLTDLQSRYMTEEEGAANKTMGLVTANFYSDGRAPAEHIIFDEHPFGILQG